MTTYDNDPWAEHDEALGYDADHNDAGQYCVHGTFIGSWWGPDYLCGWCEEGISVEEMNEALEERRRATRRRVIEAAQDFHRLVMAALAESPYDAAIATALTIHILHLVEGAE